MILRHIIVPPLLVISTASHAIELPYTFSAGQPARAEEVNANFAALASVNASGGVSFGAEYILDASSSGALAARNVIVLKHDRGGNGGCNEVVYRLRTFFDNTDNQTVGGPSGATSPERIWIEAQVCTARSNPTVVSSYTEWKYALPRTSDDPNRGFSQATGSETNRDFDGDGAIDSSEVGIYRESRNSNPLAQSELVHSVISVFDETNELVRLSNFSSLVSAYETPLKIGAPLNQTFNDIMVQSYIADNSGTRLRAKNVGLILQSRPGENEPAKAIYYRMNGQSVGSLANTPFASGVVNGLWFTP
ncbi:hypothetical protein [Marinobacter sp. F4216]|uniref:hypothetical protein n=1 Tax=Marinobacter sp. F4216 TaxID=2874281 RepID=UPI001CBAEE7A|nr:hypothetical protein [Marinobacter sp. F4216]MBZ2169461.1 hypothetical protein [Marinobacter sp. F4216]